MRIALIGYGKMGHAIEEIAIERGHSIVARIDDQNQEDLNKLSKEEIDVAIEFTIPQSAAQNVSACLKSGIPVVSGTTGWNDKMEELKALCQKLNGTFFYASNFSLGVNIFFEINKRLAKIMNRFNDYSVDMEEIHHIHKKDAPSGTAITLAEGIIENLDRINDWKLDTTEKDQLKIISIREGEVPGTHSVKYRSDSDLITISHEAKGRKGFALGAVLVCEWINDKNGILTMKDFLDL